MFLPNAFRSFHSFADLDEETPEAFEESLLERRMKHLAVRKNMGTGGQRNKPEDSRDRWNKTAGVYSHGAATGPTITFQQWFGDPQGVHGGDE